MKEEVINKKPINFKSLHLGNDLIKLQPIAKDDFERLYEVASDEAIWEQHPATDRYKREVFQLFFDEAIISESAFLVFDNKTGELIGSSRYYNADLENKRIAIGYTFLAKKYWGGNYNLALKTLMLNYIFEYVNSVLFHIGANNIRSQKAIIKLGAVKIGEIDFDLNGSKILHYEYIIEK